MNEQPHFQTPLISPFAGLRPAPKFTADVIAPPYDVLDEHEARTLVQGRPWSFLHLSRAEVDLPPGTDPHALAVYAQARANLTRMRAQGVLCADPRPCYYVYRISRGDQVQTGLVAAASVAAYRVGRIRRHEVTLAAKEDDRVRQIEALGAQTGPAFLIHHRDAAIEAQLAAIASTEPAADALAADGVRHQLWVVDQPETIAGLSTAFEARTRLYIADGHHRTAAAERICANRGATGAAEAGPRDEATHERFLAVSFPADALRILAVHRLVRDLNGLDRTEFLSRIAECCSLTPSPAPVDPARPAEFGLYLDGAWYRLRLEPGQRPAADAVARLDVRLLQDQILAPILGIDDPRHDPRLDFVGGIRGLQGLMRPVDDGRMRAAFSLHPASLADLLAVADAGATMPPKCTWFETKLADGLVSLVLDADRLT